LARPPHAKLTVVRANPATDVEWPEQPVLDRDQLAQRGPERRIGRVDDLGAADLFEGHDASVGETAELACNRRLQQPEAPGDFAPRCRLTAEDLGEQPGLCL
jgi:hypothetical protein